MRTHGMSRVGSAVASGLGLVGLAGCASAPPRAPEQRNSEPRRLDAAQDPVNRYVQDRTVSGLIVSLEIDGSRISLTGAQPARIPKARRRRLPKGDSVTVVALSKGVQAAESIVSDRLLAIEENAGMIKRDKRQILVAVETPRPIDSIQVRVSATGAVQEFDVRGFFREICRVLPRDPACQDPARQ
jgi:hypothetical protein